MCPIWVEVGQELESSLPSSQIRSWKGPNLVFDPAFHTAVQPVDLLIKVKYSSQNFLSLMSYNHLP